MNRKIKLFDILMASALFLGTNCLFGQEKFFVDMNLATPFAEFLPIGPNGQTMAGFGLELLIGTRLYEIFMEGPVCVIWNRSAV